MPSNPKLVTSLVVLVLAVAGLVLTTCIRESVVLKAKHRVFVVYVMPSPLDLVSSYTRFVGWWEGWMHELIDVLLRTRRGVALDIGANIGCHSLVMSQNGEHHVWAFEPQSEPCKALRRSIAANDISNIEVFQTALGETTGANSLVHSTILGSGAMRIGKGGESIQMTTLDHVWRQQGSPEISMGKIDVEGYEKKVLRGATACFSSHPPLIFEDWGSSTQGYLRQCGYTTIVRLRHPWFGFCTKDYLAYRLPNEHLEGFLATSAHEEVHMSGLELNTKS